MARSDYQHHVDVVFVDQSVEMHVNEIHARRCPPVTEETRLDVVRSQRLSEQRILLKIDLTDRQVIRCVPVAKHPVEEIGRKWASGRFSQRFGWRGRPDHTRNGRVELEHGALHYASSCCTCLAMTRSSSVCITRTETAVPGREITDRFAAFASSSILTPRYSRPVQMTARIAGACSPIPPVNTIVSTPLSVAASPPICLRAV